MNEANILGRLYGLEPLKSSFGLFARQLRSHIGISTVLIHSVKACVVVSEGEDEASIEAIPFCDNPVKSTGAGDRFNAGYCMGLLLDCKAKQRLLCAVACAGVFIRQGTSASLEQMARFLSNEFTK